MLIRSIEKFLRDHDMPATKFGRLAAHDPRFVLDLRMGRIPRAATEKRTRQWMAQFERGTLARTDQVAEFKSHPGSYPPAFLFALPSPRLHPHRRSLRTGKRSCCLKPNPLIRSHNPTPSRPNSNRKSNLIPMRR